MLGELCENEKTLMDILFQSGRYKMTDNRKYVIEDCGEYNTDSDNDSVESDGHIIEQCMNRMERFHYQDDRMRQDEENDECWE